MGSPRKKTVKAASQQWAVVEPRVVPDWEAAHIFLEVARCGSFRAAAQKLRTSVNALRRRVDEFERNLGVPLLLRHVNGVQLTEEGAKVLGAAAQMENASFELLVARSLSDIGGEVRVSVTEGMGAHWLMPQLGDFQRANPKLTMNLRCGQKPADLLRLEADISIQLERPKEADLKVMKLGRMHLMFFAARSYLDTHGYPTRHSDLVKHRFVVMADDERQWEDAYQRFFGGLSPAGLVALRNNLSSVHGWSVVDGLGIGALPSYAPAISSDLVPLEFGVIDARDIWLVYRADAKRVGRVRKTVDWIVQSFDPRRYPWFRDEFIHPNRFGEMYKGPSLVRALASRVR